MQQKNTQSNHKDISQCSIEGEIFNKPLRIWTRFSYWRMEMEVVFFGAAQISHWTHLHLDQSAHVSSQGQWTYLITFEGKGKGKGKGICSESRYPCDYTCSSDFTSPGSGRTTAGNYWSNLGSVHQVPIMAGWAKAVWNTKFARHFYTWPALGIEPQTFWSWVQRPIHLATCSHR